MEKQIETLKIDDYDVIVGIPSVGKTSFIEAITDRFVIDTDVVFHWMFGSWDNIKSFRALEEGFVQSMDAALSDAVANFALLLRESIIRAKPDARVLIISNLHHGWGGLRCVFVGLEPDVLQARFNGRAKLRRLEGKSKRPEHLLNEETAQKWTKGFRDSARRIGAPLIILEQNQYLSQLFGCKLPGHVLASRGKGADNSYRSLAVAVYLIRSRLQIDLNCPEWLNRKDAPDRKSVV